MSSTIVVQGQPAPAAATASAQLLQADALVKVDPATAKSVRIQSSARDVAPLQTALGQWDDDALVEVEFDLGVRVWMSVAELRNSPRFNLATNVADIHVGASVRGLPSQRGIGDWVVKTLTVFEKPTASFAHAALVKKIEDGLGSLPGLYRVGSDPETDLTPFAGPAAADSPYLLFLHGTASSTKGSFGGLWRANAGAAMAQLTQRYATGHILALQHRSLSESPIDNALVVANALPAGAVLHLVSHSRGGLIGELLARAAVDADKAPFSDGEVASFAQGVSDNVAWKDAAKKLRDLNALLAQKRFRIERFVRVACPALGTTLASGKLQQWCNIVMNVLGAASTLAGSAMGTAIANLLKGLIGGLITFDDLPGLQAMDPGGPLIKLLNGEDVQTDADLAIIGGITQGSGVWNRLKMLLVDAFFTGDNDLVVDTPSMSGGTRRERGAVRYLHDAADINHFEYFTHPVTSRHLVDALSDGDRLKEGYTSAQMTHQLRDAGLATRGAKPLLSNPPIVFVLPGIMGTDLDVKGSRVWVDYGDLFFNGLDQLKVDNPDVVPVALDDDTYSGLINFLGQTHEVVAFPYDWRLALQDAGKKLNDALRAKLGQINTVQQPIRIIAHSMGGLVARAMMLREDSVWPELCKHQGARLLMLGTPNRGSHAITSLLLGQEHVLKLLSTVNIKQGMFGLLSVVRSYRGALDMMPWPNDRDYFDPDVWKQLVPIADTDRKPDKPWPQATAADLAASHDFCAALAKQRFDDTRVFYVAGQADETPVAIDILGVAPNQSLKFIGTSAGDGRVPWDTGIPAGMQAWYVNAVHGDIPANKTSWQGFLDILQTGTTSALSNKRPALARGADAVFEMRELPVSYLPDETAVRRAAIGGASSQQQPPAPPKTRIPIRVSWGDLQYASHIVMVGHYNGDTIVSAEAALDSSLNGELRRRHQLGVYPDRIGTTLVIEDADARPPGAIVVGLGEVGELSSGHLSTAISQGLMTWMAERLRMSSRTGSTPAPAGLSLLLVGSGAAGLSIVGAISALLRSVVSALDRVQHLASGIALINEIEFIELFEDRAHSLWHDLGALIEATDLKENYLRSGTLTRLPNARRRIRIDAAPEWWQRLVITYKCDRLTFNDLVSRARSEVRVLPTQRALVDRLLREATQSTRRDNELETTLFELLVPNELKDAAPRRDNLLLVLDGDTARYPWELMADPQDMNKLPQAVSIGMLRQFATPDFRREPSMVNDQTALVIGDPLGPFPELPGAQREARRVADLLTSNKGFKVKALTDRPRTSEILRALYTRPGPMQGDLTGDRVQQGYRILHLAGHGVVDIGAVVDAADGHEKESDPCACENIDREPVSGMVLEEGVYLTYVEIEQMRQVPQFVFINCCHLGAIVNDHARKVPGGNAPNEMAAQFAQKFIEIGVRAVIAAGWAVDDAAAEFFAETFYSQMLLGTTFGEAVKSARHACYENHSDTNTWAAYQCYGDPDYRIIPGNDGDNATGAKPEYASENDLIIEGIERATNDYQPGKNDVAIARQLAQLGVTATDLGLLASGRVDEALGTGYARIGRYKDAIGHYRAAIASDDSRPCAATLGAMERWTELRVRRAVEDLGQAIWGVDTSTPVTTSARRDAEAEINSAIDDFTVTLKFGRTRERLGTLAGAYKRLAVAVSGARRTAALKQMGDLYNEAAKCPGNGDDPHSVIQEALARLILARSHDGALQLRAAVKKSGARNKAASAKSAANTQAAQQEQTRIDHLFAIAGDLQAAYVKNSPPHVWTETSQADLSLMRAINENSLDENVGRQIITCYLQSLARARDYAARKAVYENVGVIYAFLSAIPNPPKATLKVLESIYRALVQAGAAATN